jgi:hypothetical protein
MFTTKFSPQKDVVVLPTTLYPAGKKPGTTGQESGWASELVWTQRLEEKSFASDGDRTVVVQSVVRHNTEWATSAPNNTW